MNVLFVCTGNICRSPMAEAILKQMVADKAGDWEVDSCGITDWNIGSQPDDRTLDVLKEHGITGFKHKARQVQPSDFDRFDYMLCMDEGHVEDLKCQASKNSKAKIELLGKYYGSDKPLVITDPYFGAAAGFERVYQECEKCCSAFVDVVSSK